jgi:hypothetical protein
LSRFLRPTRIGWALFVLAGAAWTWCLTVLASTLPWTPTLNPWDAVWGIGAALLGAVLLGAVLYLLTGNP